MTVFIFFRSASTTKNSIPSGEVIFSFATGILPAMLKIYPPIVLNWSLVAILKPDFFIKSFTSNLPETSNLLLDILIKIGSSFAKTLLALLILSQCVLFTGLVKYHHFLEEAIATPNPQTHINFSFSHPLYQFPGCWEKIAIIMDGNARWAKDRSLNIAQGYKNGAENALNLLYDGKIWC